MVYESGDVQIKTQMMSRMSNRGQERLLGVIKGLLLPSGPSCRAVPPKVPLLVRRHVRQLLMLGLSLK